VAFRSLNATERETVRAKMRDEGENKTPFDCRRKRGEGFYNRSKGGEGEIFFPRGPSHRRKSGRGGKKKTFAMVPR